MMTTRITTIVAVLLAAAVTLAGAAGAGEVKKGRSPDPQTDNKAAVDNKLAADKQSAAPDGRSSAHGTAPLGVLLGEAASDPGNDPVAAPTSGFSFSMPQGAMSFSFGFSGDGSASAAALPGGGFAYATGDPATSRTWLGVQLADVSDALATQLGLENKGVTVLNVAKDSPAEAAGLRQHDVIVRVDGREVANVESVRQFVADHEPGAEIKLDVIRGGDSLTLAATLGEFKADLAWAYDFAPDALFQEDLSFRGHLLRQKDDGSWELDDLGDLDLLEDLPEDIRKAIPQHQGFYSQVWIDNDQARTRVESTSDGERIVVEEGADGRITVQRTDAAGTTTESTYDSRESLADADEEAAALLERQPVQIFKSGKGWHGFGAMSGDFPEHVEAWREQMAEQLESAQEAIQRTMEQFHNQSGAGGASGAGGWRNLIPGDGDGKDKFFGPLGGGPGGTGRFMADPQAFQLRKPTHTFQVLPDGSIEARIRKGDTEVVRQFTDEGDLAKRAPDLHKKFSAVEKTD